MKTAWRSLPDGKSRFFGWLMLMAITSARAAAWSRRSNCKMWTSASGAGRRGCTSSRGVTLAVERGEAVGLVGPSGSGKSTLLMVMAGLERQDAGAVRIDGQDLGGMDEDDLARFRGRRVGIVFQSFHLLPTMTALENVAVPLELAGAQDAFARAEAELQHVGLGERLRITRRNCRAASSSAWRWPGRWPQPGHPGRRRADRQSRRDHRGADRGPAFRMKRERGATLVLVTHDAASPASATAPSPALRHGSTRPPRGRPGRTVDSPHSSPELA